jgi:hypothetical protein
MSWRYASSVSERRSTRSKRPTKSGMPQSSKRTGMNRRSRLRGFPEKNAILLSAGPVRFDPFFRNAEHPPPGALKPLLYCKIEVIAGPDDPVIQPNVQPGVAQPFGQTENSRLVHMAVAQEHVPLEVIRVLHARNPTYGAVILTWLACKSLCGPFAVGLTQKAESAPFMIIEPC